MSIKERPEKSWLKVLTSELMIQIKAAALQICDQRMLSITSNELHASEAMYHLSSYKNYTRILNKQRGIRSMFFLRFGIEQRQRLCCKIT